MKRILIACSVMALAACSGKDENGDGVADGVVTPDSVQQVAPSTPVGTISGQTVKLDGTALDGVKVTLILGGKTLTANSGSSGAFSFTNIAAGGMGQLILEKQGYATVVLDGAAPASTSMYYGGFPLNNGNGNLGQIGLSALTSRAVFRVVTADGAPATGANTTLDMTGVGFVWTESGSGNAVGRYSATVQVGADGLATFENIPNLLSLAAQNRAQSTYSDYGYVSFAVEPLDTNGDQLADYRGKVSSWGIANFFIDAPQPLIVLPAANSATGLEIAATNLASFVDGANSRPFKNALKGSEPVSITFNQAINEVAAARWVKVVAEDCKTDVAVSVTQVSPWTIQITPNAGWTLGNKYNIAVHVTGLETGDTHTFIGYGFGLDPAQALTLNTPTFAAFKPAGTTMETSIFRPSTGDVLYVVFNTPIEANGGGAVIQFALDINANGNTTDSGETGNMYRLGFAMSSAEQLSAVPANAGTFTCLASGFSSRYEIPVSSAIATLAGGITSGTQARVLFPLAANSTGSYNLITGATVQVDATQQAPINVSVTPSSP